MRILGVDEVGRGPWAGPMVVGAVVLGDTIIDGLNDSKKLSPKKRESFAIEIKKHALSIGIGWVSATTIDKIGLSSALKLAAKRAVAQIDCEYDEIIIDGTIKLIDDPRTSTLPKADGLISAVSAASIVAKVARDSYMKQLSKIWPKYGFDEHMGYGTKAHRQAISDNGVLPVHRQSFAPIGGRRKLPENPNETSVSIGNEAETVAAEYLLGKGHEIIARNWKTKYCEVDIISSKDNTLYFTEVKYRRDDRAGGGIDAINQKKENQMRFAAKFYLESNDLRDKVNAKLSAISLTGIPPTVETYIPDVV